MAFGSFDLTPQKAGERYPATGTISGRAVTLRTMTRDDAPGVLAFARALPPHDLLFLRQDITQPDQVEYWVRRLESGRKRTLLLVEEDGIHGYGSVDRFDHTWARHVAELRVLVAADIRGLGIGRLLTEEALRIALEMGMEKLVAQMTVDQPEAIGVFRSLGFRPEALLRDHVKDRDGETHDLVILSHDVESAQRSKIASGVIHAVGGGGA